VNISDDRNGAFRQYRWKSGSGIFVWDGYPDYVAAGVLKPNAIRDDASDIIRRALDHRLNADGRIATYGHGSTPPASTDNNFAALPPRDSPGFIDVDASAHGAQFPDPLGPDAAGPPA
jgi:hypothetical protein